MNMDENEVLVDMLRDLFGKEKHYYASKGQISFNCPYCDDGKNKGNLEINYKYGVYKCWVCAETHDTHGSIYKLIKKYGTPKLLKKYLLLKPEDDESLGKRVYKKVRLPKEFIPFKNASMGLKLTPYYKQAYNYIKSRNITDEMCDKFNRSEEHTSELQSH